MVTPVAVFDLGARFFLDGTVAQTGIALPTPGYGVEREFMFWLRVHGLP